MIESNASAAVPYGTDSPGDSSEKPDRQARKRRLRRTYSRHDLTTLKKAVKVLGARTVDRRTSVGKALAEFRADLVASLGGQDAVTTQQQVIVDLAVKQKLILDSIDAWILSQPNLVSLRKRALLPVVRERQALADALARYLGQLGLERRTSRSGRDSIDHGPGGHDDITNVVAGVLWRCDRVSAGPPVVDVTVRTIRVGRQQEPAAEPPPRQPGRIRVRSEALEPWWANAGD